MQQIGTAQSVNQSSISTSSTHGVEGIRKNKITSGHYSVLDQIFPFFDRMTQIRPLFRFIHTLLYIWYFAQILNTSCFHITFHEEDNSFTGYMTWISLSNLNSASETTFLGMFLFFACCVLVSVIVICVQWYYYSKTRKFVNWMLRLIRFVFEAVTLITLIPAASFLGVLFLRVLLNRMSTLKYVYLCFMIIFILYTLVVHILTYQFIYSSPYLANTPFGSFNGGIILFPTIIYAIFAFISCFIRTFPTWSYSIVFLILLIINVLIVVRSFSYPFLHMPFNVLYSSVFTGAIGCNAMAIVRVFVPNLFEYLPFTVGVVVMIISIFVYGFIGKKNNDFVKLKLNYPPNDESRMTEEEKHAIFQELNLINEAHGTKYLRLALFNGCDMLIDDSLIKYLIVSTNSTSVMISVLRIAACFPSMSRLMMVSLSRVISRRDISFKYRFVLYQIERITAIRNTSTSAEMTNQLNDIVNTTSILKKEITNFWLSIPNDPSIFRKLTNETTEANSRWTELLLKFPNNDRIHEEYAQFLIEVKTDFELAVLEHNKASMISVGKCQHLEKAFKLLMQNYPFYLKREILDVRGNIIKILNHKINPEKSGGTTASTFSQSSLGNSSTGFSSIDNELQLSIARSLFSHSRLRLALQGALKYRMSTNATYMLYWAAFVMIASFAVYLVQYFLLINFYDNRQANVDRMAAVADARTASCYALNYIASQWGLSTGAVMNHDELLNINKQHGGNTTIFLDPIGPSIYECAIWMRGNITNLAMEMGEIALSGLDIAEIAPSFLSEDVPYYPFVQTRMLEKETINFKTLFSYMIYATGYLVMRIKDAPNWHKDDIFLSYMKNTEGFFTSMDDIYRGFVTETALAIRQISNGNILILCIPAVVIFLLSIPFYLVFHILYCRETKKWLRLLNGVDDKYKIEASRTLDPKEKKHDTAIVSEGGSVESSSFHSITATVIVFFYLLVTLICIFYGVISMKTDQEFINLNKWMIYGSVRASASMEAMGLLLAAATMNETFYLSSPNKSEVLNRALAAGKRMLNNYNILMNGKDGLIACLGYSAELDKIHNEQKCDITQTNSSYHDIVQCNSLS
ncbi:hypothetical protein TRFO_01413 [Tritrichomonas foetus]|uniref:Uncharacterized protein n=1 Tax=Tritrichomonas foetus TaxID=1144522 RepID=A0A1J4K7R0_9EUKA|nr:hypothetical protein TRFO_01413 [Tritrichomonas foetus]|eukprot:OHT07235.1 hypothetical protein TRFO_01413 [Tritrichomonas foetus]